MSTVELKSELLRMIEVETDVNILKAIHTILEKTSLNPVLRQRLTSRALKSESDVAEGRVFGEDDVVNRTNQTK